MKKIVTIVPKGNGSKYHRLTLPLSKLGADFATQITEDLFRMYDSIWFHYKSQIHPTQLSVWRAKYGTQLILDIDDTWNIPLSHPAYDAVSENAKWSKRFALIADWVVCSTSEIEEMVKPYNENTIVVPNRIPYGEGQYQVWHESKESFMNRKIRIGYCGSISHLEDWDSIGGKMKRVIQDSEIRNKCEFVVCGVPDWNQVPKPSWIDDQVEYLVKTKYGDTPQNRERIEASLLKGHIDYNKDIWKRITKSLGNPILINGKPVENYIDLYREIDILLCPLVDNDLNKCKCIEGESFVNTTSGIKKIKNIINNKLEIYTDEHLKVINYFKYENIPTIKITTKNGYNIEGTYHHKIFINEEWVQLKDLKIKDNIELKPFDILQKEYQYVSYPMLLTKKIVKERELDCDEDMIAKIKINENWGRFLGYMVGDGHFSKVGLSISCDKRHTDVVEDVTKLIKSIGLYPSYTYKKPDKRCNTLRIKEGNALDIKAVSRTFRKISEKYNWVGAEGKKVFEVPEIILNSPKSVIKEFLKGLFESDGAIATTGITFCSKSEVLVKQVQILLLGFNIKCNTSKRFNKQYQKYYWYISIGRQGSDIFYKEIGFVSKHKRDGLKLVCIKGHSGAYKEYTWVDEIVDIEYKTNTVYDIEVEDKHQYNANGIINHNSSLKIFDAACTDTLCILGKMYDGKDQVCDLYPMEDWYNNIKRLIKNKEDLYEMKLDISEKVRILYDYTADCVLPRKEILGKKKEIELDIYGITYKDEQVTEYKEYRNKINSVEDKSYFFEANVIRNVVDSLRGDYIGVFSHKFPHKTFLSKEMVYHLIKDETVDVINFCKHQVFKDKKGNSFKYLEFTEIVHPGFMEGFKYLCDYLGLVVSEPKCVIYSGQWIAKEDVYKRFVKEILVPAMDLMETDPLMKQYAWRDSQYDKKGGLKKEDLKKYTGLDYYSLHTFMLERLPSIVIDNWNLTWKIKTEI